jgi:alpha-beta hydrolase superfamily lysophospholipase
VLLLHPGSFIWDYDSFPDIPASRRRAMLMRPCAAFAHRGFRAVVFAYPLGDYRAAVRASRREVASLRRGGRRVSAYGESSGGTLAEILALEHRVRAAAAVAGISDLASWQPDNDAYWNETLHLTLAQRRAGSPIRHVGPDPAPLLLLHSPADTIVPFSQSRRLRRADRTSELRRLTGDHLADRRALPEAADWIRRQSCR